MNIATRFPQEQEAQAAIRILAAELDRKLALRSEARAARKAARLADYVTHIRACHDRALFYHERLLASEPESADFTYYRDRYDEQCAKASEAIRLAKIERDNCS